MELKTIIAIALVVFILQALHLLLRPRHQILLRGKQIAEIAVSYTHLDVYKRQAIESAVKRHTMLPSFFSSTADAGAYELKWDGQQYSLTLTDTNGVLGDYTFSSSTTGLNFSVDGNQLTITSAQAIKGSVTIKAEKISAQRSGVVVWTEDVYKRQKASMAHGT